MKRIIVFITTYKRPDLLKSLLKQISDQGKGFEISVSIHIDYIDKSYDYLNDYLDNLSFKNWGVHQYDHCGKAGYWKLINSAYQYIKTDYENDFDYVIQLPDDIRLSDNFFNKAIDIFESIDDKYKCCLNLLKEISRNHAQWTPIEPKLINLPKGNVYRTGWVDMCYIANKYYFEILNWQINPVNGNWANDPNKSSGVGKQISERIYRNGTYFYQVETSLLIHGLHDSVMHPSHRRDNPLISNYDINQVFFGIASIPEREDSLCDTINSLLPQVGKIFVYLNRYKRIPDFCKHPKIKAVLSKNQQGDLGDIGKFFFVSSVNGYFFSGDDDLVYPPDYVARYISSIEFHCRKAVITTHGRRFDKLPVASYYRGHTESFQCLGEQTKDALIHIGGTGVMAFHTDFVKPTLDEFKLSNMADIWMAIYCHKNNIPIVSVVHHTNWIKESRKYDKDYTIYNFCNHNDAVQTKIINDIKWKPKSKQYGIKRMGK